MKYEHEVKRKFDLPEGGSMTVTVSSPEPINEDQFLILQPQAAIEMARCLLDLGRAVKPSES